MYTEANMTRKSLSKLVVVGKLPINTILSYHSVSTTVAKPKDLGDQVLLFTEQWLP